MVNPQPPSHIDIPGGVYVTKYALTQGILFYPKAHRCYFNTWNSKANDWDQEDPDMVSVARGTNFMGEGRDWHLTLEGAQARARDLVDAKRKSIDKELKRLDNLDFTPKTVEE